MDLRTECTHRAGDSGQTGRTLRGRRTCTAAALTPGARLAATDPTRSGRQSESTVITLEENAMMIYRDNLT